MRPRRTDLGALAAGALFLAVAALFLYTALSGVELLPFAYQAVGFAAALVLVLLVRWLLPPRR
ncbi:hypothetical protein [Actinocorallia aurantiaca]|uniref:Uncharacterized protein n=1 Tax=Actinocorallia aurantiaca TaxID=46204 RepID=A0ABN3TTJ6_9ACTN